ncbi:MAG: winged helix DNA-binding domain-containing protein [Patescibacteria group bacterium]
MKFSEIPYYRLHNQLISQHPFKKVKDVVAWLGAVQAQDYNASLWAIGLRLPNSTSADIEKAIKNREIIRLWPMRGTIHFVAKEDARWMHQLLTPRLNNTYSERSNRLGITPEIIKKSKELFTKALKGDKHLTREALYQILEDAGISTKNSIGLHIAYRMAHEGLIVCAPREGKKHTFALFDEYVPEGRKFKNIEEAITELVIRYFTSHGPAQIQDLMWWSGLTSKDVRAGIELAGKKLQKLEIQGKYYYSAPVKEKVSMKPSVHLLPPFDEYVVAYRDRNAVLEEVHKEKINPGANGMLSAVVVIDGQVVGNWKRALGKKEVSVVTNPFLKFTFEENKSIEQQQEIYKKFL